MREEALAGENSLKLSLCRLFAWARSPPRQQEDKAFVTSFGYYLGAIKLRERTAVYDNVKTVIFKNWVLGKEFRFSIGTNDNGMVDELPDSHSVYQ